MYLKLQRNICLRHRKMFSTLKGNISLRQNKQMPTLQIVICCQRIFLKQRLILLCPKDIFLYTESVYFSDKVIFLLALANIYPVSFREQYIYHTHCHVYQYMYFKEKKRKRQKNNSFNSTSYDLWCKTSNICFICIYIFPR